MSTFPVPRNTAAVYTLPAVVLHRLSAVLIIVGFVMGLAMTDMPGLSPAKLRYFSWHKWIGLTVLLVLVARVGWRIGHPPPALPAGVGRWQRRMAQGVHLALYALLLTVPFSGLLYSQAAGVPVVYLGLVDIPALMSPDAQAKAFLRTVHWVLNYVLLALVVAHVLAALKHQFIERDNLLARMLPLLARRNS